MTGSSNTPRNAYLRHLKTNSHSYGSSGGGSGVQGSQAGSIPVWKQRQLRNREQQQVQEQQPATTNKSTFAFPSQTLSPPPPPPPPPLPSSSTSSAEASIEAFSIGNSSPSFSAESGAGLAQGRKQLVGGAIVPPESPLLTPCSSRSSSKFVVTPTGSETEEDFPAAMGGNTSGAKSNKDLHRFAFFQATSPTFPKRRLSDKINAFSLKEISSKDPSDDTQTTHLSSNGSLDEDEERTPAQSSTKTSLAAAWQEHAQSTLTPSVSTHLPTKTNHSEMHTPKAAVDSETTEVDLKTPQNQKDGEEEEVLLTDSSLQVIGASKANITAKNWQELIRKKQDKLGRNSSNRVLPVPSAQNETKNIKTEAGPEDSSPWRARTEPSGDSIAPFSASAPNSSSHSEEEGGTIVTTPVGSPGRDALSTDDLHWYSPEELRSPPRSMVPFFGREEEKKDGEQQAVVVAENQDEEFFEDVLHSVAVSVGADVEELCIAGVVQRMMMMAADDAFLMEMIRDCEDRWKDSAKLEQEVRPSPLAYLALAPSESEQTKLLELQQAEILDLRSKVTEQTVYEQKQQALARVGSDLPATPTSGGQESTPVAPIELIDSIPFEHIEVAVIDDQDVCSVTSGLTNLNDLARGGFVDEVPSFAAFSDPFGHEPRSPTDRLVTKIVRRVPVELQYVYMIDGWQRAVLALSHTFSSHLIQCCRWIQSEGFVYWSCSRWKIHGFWLLSV